MKHLLLKSAIINATVTEADLSYIGSITIDEDLLDRVNLKVGENVTVVDHTNGNRLETYVIIGERGSRIICMNGAAAHLVKKGDIVTIMADRWTDDVESPGLILVDKENRFVRFLEKLE